MPSAAASHWAVMVSAFNTVGTSTSATWALLVTSPPGAPWVLAVSTPVLSRPVAMMLTSVWLIGVVLPEEGRVTEGTGPMVVLSSPSAVAWTWAP